MNVSRRDKPIDRETLDKLMMEIDMAKDKKPKHDDVKEDKALIRKMVKEKDLKKRK